MKARWDSNPWAGALQDAIASPAQVLGFAGPGTQPLDPMGEKRWPGWTQGPNHSCWCPSFCRPGVGMWTKGGLQPFHPREGRCPRGRYPLPKTTSALGPISQERQILAVGSKGPPGRLSRRTRNVPAPHSM